jgi:hypothetical protein
MVTLESFTSPWDAHIVRALLESEGIPATVAHEGHIGLNWALSQALGGVKLQVPEAFAERAQQVLADYHAGKFEAALEEEQHLPPDACTSCGSRDLQPIPAMPALALLAAFFAFFGVIFPPARAAKRCRACGTRIEDAP